MQRECTSFESLNFAEGLQTQRLKFCATIFRKLVNKVNIYIYEYIYVGQQNEICQPNTMRGD